MNTTENMPVETQTNRTVKIAGLSTILLGMSSYIFQSIGGYVVGTVSALYIFALILLGAFVLCNFKWARIASLVMSILLVPYVAYFALAVLTMSGYKSNYDLTDFLRILVVLAALGLAIVGAILYSILIRKDITGK